MDFLIWQTSAASPAEPGELLFWLSEQAQQGIHYVPLSSAYPGETCQRLDHRNSLVTAI